MKITIGVIIGILLGMVIVAALAAVLIVNLFNSNNPPVVQTPVAPFSTALISQSPTLSNRSSPVSSIPPEKSVTATNSTPTTNSGVFFTLKIASVSSTGLTSRDITGQIGNSGSSDAHNVSAKVEVLCQGSPVRINNQESVNQLFGTIKAGDSVSETIALEIGISDAVKISQYGATIKLTITSDEKTQTLDYDYRP